MDFEEFPDLQKVSDNVDVIYITRIQKERLNSKQGYEQVKNSYVVDREFLNQLNENTIIMHPLPRVNEISPEVDNDKRAAYFRQAKNGLYIRMAILQMIVNE